MAVFRNISIHSTRVGGDLEQHPPAFSHQDFNPLHPCGRRLFNYLRRTGNTIFQSTPPVWAETMSVFRPGYLQIEFQSTPPVWAETLIPLAVCSSSPFQSTPPVWAETLPWAGLGVTRLFQSTPPVWAETGAICNVENHRTISIHSTRVGGDRRRPGSSRTGCEISIHSTRVGGDLLEQEIITLSRRFQSTPPVWAET